MLNIEDGTTEIFSDLRKCNEEQTKWISDLRDIGKMFINHLEQIPNCRRKSIAITELETAILFATKAATYGA